jgi:hypothetical protein
MLAALSSQEIEHMLLNWKGGGLSKWKDRALKPKLSDCAGPAYADRNPLNAERCPRHCCQSFGANLLLAMQAHAEVTLFDVA